MADAVKKETRADRLHRLLAKAFPDHADHISTCNWRAIGADSDAPAPIAEEGGELELPTSPAAPYVFDVTPRGKPRLRFTDPVTGDSIGVVVDGPATRNTPDVLLDAMEEKLS